MRLSGTWNYKPVSIISGSTCESMQETHEDSCLVLRPFTRGSEHSTDGSMEHGCKSAVSSRSPQTIPFFLPCFRGFQTLPSLLEPRFCSRIWSCSFILRAQAVCIHLTRPVLLLRALPFQPWSPFPGGAHCFLTHWSSCHTPDCPSHGSWVALTKSLLVRLWSYLPCQGPSHSPLSRLTLCTQLCLLSAVLKSHHLSLFISWHLHIFLHTAHYQKSLENISPVYLHATTSEIPRDKTCLSSFWSIPTAVWNLAAKAAE